MRTVTKNQYSSTFPFGNSKVVSTITSSGRSSFLGLPQQHFRSKIKQKIKTHMFIPQVITQATVIPAMTPAFNTPSEELPRDDK